MFERTEITGWVAVPRDAAPVRVGLYLNSDEVTGRWVVGDGGADEVRVPFRFAVYDLWRFARHTDRISVRADGRALRLADGSLFHRPVDDGEESLGDLRRRFAEGQLFGQNGRIQIAKDRDSRWQAEVLDLYRRVSELLVQEHGYRPFLYNGTLLGAVRDGGFIGHDIDFDCAYISRETRGRAASAELERIATTLVRAGFFVTPKWSCVAVSETLSATMLDLFHLYREPDGTIAFPFGTVGESDFGAQHFGDLREIDLAGRRVLVPADPEAVVEHLYGANWSTPDPGFSWEAQRRRRAREGLLRADWQDRIYWHNFYTHHPPFERPSPFAEHVLTRPDLPAAVIDLGCGDGRDSAAFVARGHHVIALDRSAEALAHARTRLEVGAGGGTEIVACDVCDGAALASVVDELRDRRDGGPILFYARLLVNSITEQCQAALLTLLADHGRPGDLLAFEFRSDKDQRLPKAFERRSRRFQSGSGFIDLTSTRGYAVVEHTEGRGLAPFPGEDPEIVRVLAHRRHG